MPAYATLTPVKLQKLFGHPAIYTLLFCVFLETLLPRLFPVSLSPDLPYARNPFGRRNWDDFIKVTSVPHEPETRILLLSNSQGRGPEYAALNLYASLIQQKLNRLRPAASVRVVNWSFGPNRVPEAIVLLARAQELNPHISLAVFPPFWFQAEDYVIDSKPTPLSMLPSDICETAWLYRDRFPKEFTEHYLTPITIVKAYLARYTNTYRYRDLPISYFRKTHPWARPFTPDGVDASWFSTGRGSLRTRQVKPTRNFPLPWPHAVLMKMFTDTAERLPGRKIFVLQPHCLPILPSHQDSLNATRGHFIRNGWEVWDMMTAVPWYEFLEDSLHLSAQGHRIFANALEGRLTPLLRELD